MIEGTTISIKGFNKYVYESLYSIYSFPNTTFEQLCE